MIGRLLRRGPKKRAPRLPGRRAHLRDRRCARPCRPARPRPFAHRCAHDGAAARRVRYTFLSAIISTAGPRHARCSIC